MSEEKIYNLIGKKLAGELKDNESLQLNDWISQNPDNQRIFQILKKSWELDTHQPPGGHKDRLFAKVVSGIDDHSFRHQDNGITRRFLKYAVGALLFFLVGILLSKQDFFSPYLPQKVALIKKENLNGQKSTIHLPDGSKVFLNGGSKLTYPSSFEKNTREVELMGEAYFDVVSDPNYPFVVRALGVEIKAIGTEFNVNVLNENVTVGLVEGNVEVILTESRENSLMLKPGEMAFMDEKKELIKSHFSIEKMGGWKDGRLIFSDASIEEVIHKLERWYGVEIFLRGPAAQEEWEYNGEFKDERLRQVLNSMSFIQDFDYIINDKQVTILLK
ncbi:MAG: DUF4974 domain-containing protein [Cytophagales bacterium]|nr:DUF4974 domain-containing protein [Cytophagales bacterium]